MDQPPSDIGDHDARQQQDGSRYGLADQVEYINLRSDDADSFIVLDVGPLLDLNAAAAQQLSELDGLGLPALAGLAKPHRVERASSAQRGEVLLADHGDAKV